MSDDRDSVVVFINEYCSVVKSGLTDRWKNLDLDIYNREVFDTIGALLARQATFAVELAQSPGIWNGHIAPLILRGMTDVHITLAWILGDPKVRSKEYVRYGLGQERLFIEYLETEEVSESEEYLDNKLSEMIKMKRSWLDEQLADWAIEINVGSWSGKSTRDMAKEADCESLYKFAYVPFSGAAHSMWQHVGVYNVMPCINPLHKNHKVPFVPEIPSDPDYLYRASKYVSRTYSLIDEKFSIKSEIPLPLDFFVSHEVFSKNQE